MTVAPIPDYVQPSLLDLMPFNVLDAGSGQQRAYSGAAVQTIVARLLDLTPIPGSGSYDVVFDAGKDGHYYEIKSLRRGSKCPIYDWRLAKEKGSGVPVSYIFAVHRRQVKNAVNSLQIWADLSNWLEALLVVPLSAVIEAHAACPLRTIKTAETLSGKRNGYQRKGYCEGYRDVPFEALAHGSRLERKVHEYVYGLPFWVDVLCR